MYYHIHLCQGITWLKSSRQGKQGHFWKIGWRLEGKANKDISTIQLTVILLNALYSRNVNCSASSLGWRLLNTSETFRVECLVEDCRTDMFRIQS